MVKVKVGDLFQSESQTWVNTVNCVGVMGKGVALEFKKRFPDMFRDYAARCAAGEVRLGCPYLFKRVVAPWILNFPTKDDWRSVSRMSDIIAGLEHIARHYREWGIESLAVPPLGCGQGQLEWSVVGRTLYRELSRLDIPVELYAPFDVSEAETRPEFLSAAATGPGPRPRVEPAWIAVVAALERLEREPYHWPVGRTTFQKIAYFATESGIPTGLRFERGSYGPHASDLKRQITVLANNGLIVEQRLGRMFRVLPGPTFGDALRRYADDIAPWAGAIEKIADLFQRIDTHRAEVAASVHFAAHRIVPPGGTERDVLAAVMDWKIRRRPPLERDEVASAVRHLNALSWLSVGFSEDLGVPDPEAAA